MKVQRAVITSRLPTLEEIARRYGVSLTFLKAAQTIGMKLALKAAAGHGRAKRAAAGGKTLLGRRNAKRRKLTRVRAARRSRAK